MKKILEYLRPQMWVMIWQFTVKFAGTLIELLLPIMLSHILNNIVVLNDMNAVYFWGGLMVLCSAVALLANVYANQLSTKISKKITQKLRYDLFRKTEYLSCKKADEFLIPSLISRLTSDTYNVHQMIDRMQRLGIRAPILLIGGILLTFTLEPVLTLVLVCVLPLLGFIIWLISHKGIPLYTKTQISLDTLVRKIQENMTGVRVIKALSKTDYETERFEEANLNVVKNEQKANALMAITNPAMNLLLNAGLIVVIIIGAYRVNADFTKPGTIIAFMNYFVIILNALLMVSRLFVLLSKGAASAERISEVLCSEEDILLIESEKKPSEFHIEYNSVDFSYNGIRNDLEGISFKIKRGETLGIIGGTGSGKTTLISLLLRFYDPNKGEILIDGRNIKSIPNEILHTRFGVVFQNDFLFADTIRENINFGRSLDNDAIEHAVRTAQANFVYEKENGFAHELTVKGANLSGGQKQRLLISRALAANPDILLLDDCSSALDYKTDASLRKAMKQEFDGTTTIIITQRISSIMGADHIIMLDEGKIIGQGTHSTLLDSNSAYREIFDAQMGEVL